LVWLHLFWSAAANRDAISARSFLKKTTLSLLAIRNGNEFNEHCIEKGHNESLRSDEMKPGNAAEEDANSNSRGVLLLHEADTEDETNNNIGIGRRDVSWIVAPNDNHPDHENENLVDLHQQQQRQQSPTSYQVQLDEQSLDDNRRNIRLCCT
jgi:hypothetical protein